MIKNSRVDIDSLKPLKKYITDSRDPKYFITFTEINKIGINPRKYGGNVVGVYCYPLTEIVYDRLINGEIGFAGNKPYINLFAISKPALNLGQYRERNLKRDLEILNKKYNLEIDVDYYDDVNIWNIVKNYFNNAKANSVFRKDLGYDAIYDPGTRTISADIDAEAIVLNPSIIVPIETFLNPFGQVVFEDERAGDLTLSSKEDQDIFEKKRMANISDYLILKLNMLRTFDPEYSKLKQILLKKINLALKTINLDFFNKIKDLKDDRLFSEILSKIIFEINNNANFDKITNALAKDTVDLKILDLIFNELGSEIQVAVAEKTENEKLIESLVEDMSLYDGVRIGIANNKNVDHSLLVKLLGDPSEEVRAAVKKRLREELGGNEMVNRSKVDRVERSASMFYQLAKFSGDYLKNFHKIMAK